MGTEREKEQQDDLLQAVADFQQGNKEAFARIYDKTKKYVYYTIYKSVQDPSLTEDIMQETYLEVYRGLPVLQNKGAIKNWIGKIAHHCIYHYLSKSQGFFLQENGEEDVFSEIEQTDEALMPEEAAENREVRRLIGEIINGLSGPQRQVILAFYYNQMSIPEIAEVFGIPENTVKSHLYRGKEKLKQEILRLEKEKGTKLYTVGLSALLFFVFGDEAQACEVPSALGSKILQTGQDETFGSPGKETKPEEAAEAARKTAGAAAGMAKTGLVKNGLAVKLGLAVAGIAAAGGIAWGVVSHIQGQQGTESPVSVVETESAGEGKMPAATEAASLAAVAETAENEAPETETGEEIPEGEYRYLKELEAVERTEMDSLLNGGGGVVPIERDGLWGAINYEGELIVPCEYAYGRMAPNELGQFILGDEDTEYAFDKEGNLIAQANDITSVYGDYVTMINRTGSYDEYGDEIRRGVIAKLDGTVLAQMDSVEYSFGVVGFGDSDAAYLGDPTRLIRVGRDGSVQEFLPGREEVAYEEGEWEGSGESDADLFHVPGGAVLNGCYADDWAITEEFCLMDGGKIAGGIDPWPLAEKYWGDQKGDVWSMNVRRVSILHHGGFSYNYGTKVGLRYYDPDTNELLGCILADVSRNDTSGDLASLDCILGFYDNLFMGTGKYWLIQTEGKWGFIDQDGNIRHLYEKASEFINGYAVVIENGMGYLMDESFEKLEELGPVLDCVAYGEMFILKTEEGNRYYQLRDGAISGRRGGSL